MAIIHECRNVVVEDAPVGMLPWWRLSSRRNLDRDVLVGMSGPQPSNGGGPQDWLGPTMKVRVFSIEIEIDGSGRPSVFGMLGSPSRRGGPLQGRPLQGEAAQGWLGGIVVATDVSLVKTVWWGRLGDSLSPQKGETPCDVLIFLGLGRPLDTAWSTRPGGGDALLGGLSAMCIEVDGCFIFWEFSKPLTETSHENLPHHGVPHFFVSFSLCVYLSLYIYIYTYMCTIYISIYIDISACLLDLYLRTRAHNLGPLASSGSNSSGDASAPFRRVCALSSSALAAAAASVGVGSWRSSFG